MSDRVRALVPTGYGLNCEAETAHALRLAGAEVSCPHVADVLETPGRAFEGVRILVMIGGFSFGDHVASGRVYANRLRFRLGEHLARFVDDGGLVLGICNGFQTLVKLGLLPALDRAPGQPLAAQTASLVGNERVGYRNAWVRLAVDPASPCVFTRGLEGTLLEMPSRHGEGNLVFVDEAARARVLAQHLVPVRFVDSLGVPTETWPENPSGSQGGAAGLCDRTGRVFGLMPHPEAFLYPENHPQWPVRRPEASGSGLGIFSNAVRAAAR